MLLLRDIAILIAISTAYHTATAHPHCHYDEREVDFDRSLTYCSMDYATDGVCCTELEEVALEETFNAVGNLTTECADYYKQVGSMKFQKLWILLVNRNQHTLRGSSDVFYRFTSGSYPCGSQLSFYLLTFYTICYRLSLHMLRHTPNAFLSRYTSGYLWYSYGTHAEKTLFIAALVFRDVAQMNKAPWFGVSTNCLQRDRHVISVESCSGNIPTLHLPWLNCLLSEVWMLQP